MISEKPNLDIDTLPLEEQLLLGEIMEQMLTPEGELRETACPLLERHSHLRPFVQELVRGIEMLCEGKDVLAVQRPGRAKARIGEFEILGELGRGGMGVVYSAWQTTMERKVALKVLPQAAVIDERQLLRFENETRAAGQLHHPNIVPVFGAGEFDGVHYYYMPQIEGASLQYVLSDAMATMDGHHRNSGRQPDIGSDGAIPTTVANPAQSGRLTPNGRAAQPATSTSDVRLLMQAASKNSADDTSAESGLLDVGLLAQDAASIEEGQRSEESRRSAGGSGNAERVDPIVGSRRWVEQAVQWIIQAGDALHYAHECGVIHRDVKPSNILLDRSGKIWVTDFGLAHYEANGSVTRTGDILGTARYMSPEQASGEHWRVDHRTDVYSLGVTLLELLTLSKFELTDGEREPQGREHRRASFESERAHRANPAIAYDLETVLIQATAAGIDDRYESAGALVADLERWSRGEAIHARRPAWTERLIALGIRHSRKVAAVVAVMAFCFVAMMGLYVWTKNQSDQRETAYELAVGNVRESRRVVDDIVVKLTEDLRGIDEAQSIRMDTLEKIVAYYQDCLQHHVQIDGMERDAATAAFKLGQVYEETGRLSAAAAMYARADQLFQRESGAAKDAAPDRATCLMALGDVRYRDGMVAEAEKAWDRAERTLSRPVEDGDSHEGSLLLADIVLRRATLAVDELATVRKSDSRKIENSPLGHQIERLHMLRSSLLPRLESQPGDVAVLLRVARCYTLLARLEHEPAQRDSHWETGLRILAAVYQNEGKPAAVCEEYATALTDRSLTTEHPHPILRQAMSIWTDASEPLNVGQANEMLRTARLLTSCYEQIGQNEAAVRVMQQSVGLLDKSPLRETRRWVALRAIAQSELGRQLHLVQRCDESLEVTDRSIRLFRSFEHEEAIGEFSQSVLRRADLLASQHRIREAAFSLFELCEYHRDWSLADTEIQHRLDGLMATAAESTWRISDPTLHDELVEMRRWMADAVQEVAVQEVAEQEIAEQEIAEQESDEDEQL